MFWSWIVRNYIDWKHIDREYWIYFDDSNTLELYLTPYRGTLSQSWRYVDGYNLKYDTITKNKNKNKTRTTSNWIWHNDIFNYNEVRWMQK